MADEQMEKQKEVEEEKGWDDKIETMQDKFTGKGNQMASKVILNEYKNF